MPALAPAPVPDPAHAIPDGVTLLATCLNLHGHREWLVLYRGAEVHVFETGDREIPYRASVPGYGNAGHTLAAAVTRGKYPDSWRAAVDRAAKDPGHFTSEAKAGRCYDSTSLLVRSLVCPRGRYHPRSAGESFSMAQICWGGRGRTTVLSIYDRVHCRFVRRPYPYSGWMIHGTVLDAGSICAEVVS
jgi:hypothetical protein